MESKRTVIRALSLVILFYAMMVTSFAADDGQARLRAVQNYIKQEGLDWIAGETSVSGLTPEEFKALLTLQPPADFVRPIPKPRSYSPDFPAVFDWRTMDGVTGVRNQRNCGSCWAFSAIGALESQVLINDGWPADLSEQQLVSCDQFNSGCSGGWITTAWDFLMDLGSVAEECMPYQASDSVTCIMKRCDVVTGVAGYEHIDDTVAGIKEALQIGPVACAMYVYDDFQYYTSGCYEHTGSTQNVNHGVVIVGWDDTVCETGAWIVKNSWGPGFGEDGFFYIKYGTCNIGYGAAVVYRKEIPPVQFRLSGTDIIDDNDGVATAGETFSIAVALENFGPESAPSFSAQLSCDSPDVTILRNTATFLDIASKSTGSSINPHFEVQIATTLASLSQLEFQLQIADFGDPIIIPFNLLTGPYQVAFRDNFEGLDDGGWTHSASRGTDDWVRGGIEENTIFDPFQPWSGGTVWGNRLTGNGNYKNNATNQLVSPTIDCSDCDGAILRFRRWLTVERSKYDHAIVTVNGETIWENDFVNHNLDGSWVECSYDISQYADHQSEVVITFDLTTDEGLVFGGWTIDDVEILTRKPAITDDFAVEISTNAPRFAAGDQFTLIYELFNNLEAEEFFEAVILDVSGAYYYWPSWTEAVDGRIRTIQLGAYSETLLDFQWPENVSASDGFLFWAAVLNPDDLSVVDVASTTFACY